MSQTSYSINQAAAREGGLYDLGDHDILSFVNAAAIPFGKLVVRDTADDAGKLPAASTDVTDAKKVLGLAIAKQDIESSASGVAQYPAQSQVPVMRRGRAWVKVEGAVTPASDVFVRYAAGGDGLGSFGATAGTSARAQLANAKYLTSAGVGGFAVVDFNIT
jgi:hypothetical protein